jgi:hypothetical protein
MLYRFLSQLRPSQERLLVKYLSRKAKPSQHLSALITGRFNWLLSVAPSLRLYFSGSEAFGEKMRTSGTQTVSWAMAEKSRRWEFSPICVYLRSSYSHELNQSDTVRMTFCKLLMFLHSQKPISRVSYQSGWSPCLHRVSKTVNESYYSFSFFGD